VDATFVGGNLIADIRGLTIPPGYDVEPAGAVPPELLPTEPLPEAFDPAARNPFGGRAVPIQVATSRKGKHMRKNLFRLGAAAALIAAAAAVAPAPAARADTVCESTPQVVAVGPTSCQFAINVANQMMSGGGTSFTAFSPTTGENYWMHCSIEHHGSTTCRGGDDAEVDIY